MSDTDKFTLVFERDLRAFKGNPLKAETPFGIPYAVAFGDALDRIERLEAENASLKERLNVLPPEAFEALMKALDNPPEPTEKLREMFREYRQWKRSGGEVATAGIVMRRFGSEHEKPCNDPNVLTCAKWECQKANRCALAGEERHEL